MPVVERYSVQFLNGPLAEVERWTVPGCPLLMGGSIISQADAEHLRRNHAVTHVLNLETEHSDAQWGFVLCENQTPDNGEMKSAEWFRTGIDFVKSATGRVYLHCQAGGSRTPMMLYALLRAYGNDPGAALALIQTVKPSFGSAPYHVNYIASAEKAL